LKRKFEENMLGLHHAWGICDAISAGFPHIANCRSGLRVFGIAEGVLAGKAKGLKLLREIVSELD
jgi:hypothetical protein